MKKVLLGGSGMSIAEQIATHEKNERRRAALAECLIFLKHAPVSFESGRCMCGETATDHSMYAGHPYTDSGRHTADAVIEKAEAALGGLV